MLSERATASHSRVRDECCNISSVNTTCFNDVGFPMQRASSGGGGLYMKPRYSGGMNYKAGKSVLIIEHVWRGSDDASWVYRGVYGKTSRVIWNTKQE